MLPLAEVNPVLAIEASTAAGSVALFAGGRLLAEADVPMGAGQRDGLFPAIRALLDEASLAPTALGAVVCGAGPGSFTSLRIAAALAKGVAHGAQRPLYAVSSLLLAGASIAGAMDEGAYLVHADALRGERYALWLRRRADGLVEPTGAVVRTTVDALAAESRPEQRVSVGGSLETLPGAFIATPRCRFLPSIGGSWREAAVDLATWEPAYGRLAEAQVKWEASHGMALPAVGPA